MTLVYRSQRFQKPKQVNQLSPVSYNANKIKVHSPQHKNVFKKSKQKPQQIISNLGPGQYHHDDKQNINISQNAVFQSKVQRFKDKPKKQQAQNKKQDQQNILPFNQSSNTKQNNTGKLRKPQQSQYHFNYHRINCQGTNTICIPSIPNNHQSYGYRIDNKTNQLVLNQNPHVLLANTTSGFNNAKLLLDSLYNGPGAYFRSDGSLQKSRGLKWVKPSSQNNSFQQNCDEQQIYSEENNKYKKKWEQKGNAIVSKQPRGQVLQITMKDRKQKIILNGIRRKFERYLDSAEIDHVLKMQSQQKPAKLTENKQKAYRNIPQCFLSKQKRFKIKNNNDNNQISYLNNLSKNNGLTNTNSPPFDHAASRFNDNSNKISHIGPGDYKIDQYCSYNKLGGYWFKQSKNKNSLQSILPGPGSYLSHQDYSKQINGRQPQRVYNVKQQMKNQSRVLLENKGIKWPQIYKQKDVQTRTKCQIGNQPINQRQVLTKVKQIVQEYKSDNIKLKLNHNSQQKNKGVSCRPLLKAIKKQILPAKQSPGPGAFEISGNLNKKTYNVTYD